MMLLWPFLLPLLLVVPVLIGVYIWIQRRRQRYALRYASVSMLKEAVGPGPGIRRHIPPALFLLSLTAMILALTRPVAQVKVPGFEGTVMLTMDVSGSMAADDVQPSRMEAAKEAARAFVANQPSGVEIGVVAFSNNALLVQAPTNNLDAVSAAINRLQPQRGTAIGDGLLTSLQALDEPVNGSDAPTQPVAPNAAPTPTPTPVAPGAYVPKIIVLLSDGQNTVGTDPLEIAPQARDRGIRVFTVGLGTPEGTILHMRGRGMRVRLDEATLKGIAEVTDGKYFNASTEKDLRVIYENLGREFGYRTERTELTAFVTAAAAGLAVLAGLLSLLWFSRLP